MGTWGVGRTNLQNSPQSATNSASALDDCVLYLGFGLPRRGAVISQQDGHRGAGTKCRTGCALALKSDRDGCRVLACFFLFPFFTKWLTGQEKGEQAQAGNIEPIGTPPSDRSLPWRQ